MATHKKVYLEISNLCNLNCAFCPGTSRTPKRLNEAEFSHLAKKVNNWAEYLYFHLMGEPTAHPLLPRFIEISKGLGLKPIITTNGTLLPKRETELISAELYKINVSLHAFEANEIETSFEDYVSGCISYVKKSAENGTITVLRLWNLDGKTDGALNEKNGQILKSLHKAFPDEWVKTHSGFRLCHKVFLEWGDKFDWPSINGEILSEKGFCYGLRDQIGILCDGTVVPCCLDSNGDIPLGNLFEEDLETILNSPRAKKIYDGFTNHSCAEELCKHCMRAGYYRYMKG